MTRQEKRNILGICGYFLLSMLTGFFAEVVMIPREIYQYRHCKLSRFEWDDVFRYTVVILLGTGIHYRAVLPAISSFIQS